LVWPRTACSTWNYLAPIKIGTGPNGYSDRPDPEWNQAIPGLSTPSSARIGATPRHRSVLHEPALKQFLPWMLG
jgi:hypothetical protein